MSTYKELIDRLKNGVQSADFNVALAEAVEILTSLDAQKPAAWWYPKGEQFAFAKEDGSRPFAKVWEPLYAAPVAAQASKPLSDAEIFDLAEPFGSFEFGDAQGNKRLDFARSAITAFCQKNGIKERG